MVTDCALYDKSIVQNMKIKEGCIMEQIRDVLLDSLEMVNDENNFEVDRDASYNIMKDLIEKFTYDPERAFKVLGFTKQPIEEVWLYDSERIDRNDDVGLDRDLYMTDEDGKIVIQEDDILLGSRSKYNKVTVYKKDSCYHILRYTAPYEGSSYGVEFYLEDKTVRYNDGSINDPVFYEQGIKPELTMAVLLQQIVLGWTELL